MFLILQRRIVFVYLSRSEIVNAVHCTKLTPFKCIETTKRMYVVPGPKKTFPTVEIKLTVSSAVTIFKSAGEIHCSLCLNIKHSKFQKLKGTPHCKKLKWAFQNFTKAGVRRVKPVEF